MRTVQDWCATDPQGFGAQYSRARADGYDVIAASTLRIADDATNDYVDSERGPRFNAEHVQRSKLRIETRMRLLKCWDPKRYGEKITQEHIGTPMLPATMNYKNLTDDELATLQALMEKANATQPPNP